MMFNCEWLSKIGINKDQDKWRHIGVGFIISIIMASSVFLIVGEYSISVLVGMGSTFIAGLAKELIDYEIYGGFSKADLAYTVIGGFFGGAVFHFVLNDFI